MSASRRSFCLIPGVLALMLSGCASLSEPVQQPPQTAGMSVPSPAAEREKAEAEREAVAYQTRWPRCGLPAISVPMNAS